MTSASAIPPRKRSSIKVSSTTSSDFSLHPRELFDDLSITGKKLRVLSQDAHQESGSLDLPGGGSDQQSIDGQSIAPIGE